MPQHADQAAANAVAGRELPGDILLAILGRVAVADLAALLPRQAHGGLLQAGGDLQAVGGEVLVGDALGPEVALQAAAVGEVAQGAGQGEAVEAAEHAADDGGELGEESDHGVPVAEGVRGTTDHCATRNASLQAPLVAALPRQGISGVNVQRK
jgi:hypothetical protein